MALIFAGQIGMLELTLFAVTFPGVLIGFLLSALLVRRLPFEAMRPLILVIAALAGAGALARGFLG